MIDEQSHVVGIVSQHDLVSDLAPVELFINTPLEYLDETASLQRIIFRMLEKKISCVLIGHGKEDVVGIVTTDDLLWHLVYLLEKESEQNKEPEEPVFL